MKTHLRFGKLDLNNLIGRLFWFGNIPIALYSYNFVKHFNVANTTNNIIQQSNKEYTYAYLNMPLGNKPLAGILLLIISLVSGIVLWRLTCEIIFIIVRYYKNNTKVDIS